VPSDGRDQRIDDLWIELGASPPADLFERGLVADAATVRPVAGDRDERITGRDHAAGERDLLARRAVRVSATVPALVV
jgi:hypothetical protein